MSSCPTCLTSTQGRGNPEVPCQCLKFLLDWISALGRIEAAGGVLGEKFSVMIKWWCVTLRSTFTFLDEGCLWRGDLTGSSAQSAFRPCYHFGLSHACANANIQFLVTFHFVQLMFSQFERKALSFSSIFIRNQKLIYYKGTNSKFIIIIHQVGKD